MVIFNRISLDFCLAVSFRQLELLVNFGRKRGQNFELGTKCLLEIGTCYLTFFCGQILKEVSTVIRTLMQFAFLLYLLFTVLKLISWNQVMD